MFSGIVDTKLESAEQLKGNDLDLVFLALPHGVSMEYVQKFKDESFKIVDLSGDFRLKDEETYKKWYGKDHTYPKGIKQAVFGLSEIFNSEISKAKLVANPGCFPTASILAIAPLVDAGVIKEGCIIVDAKTGVTGAGVKPKNTTHFPQVNDNFSAYGLLRHRHTIEIEDTVNHAAKIDSGKFSVQFTPHLLPVDRGIYATVYLQPNDRFEEIHLRDYFNDYYRQKPFIRLSEKVPSLKEVRGSNYCNLYPTFDDRTGQIIVISAIDNLVKGAAGQAVQNMNLMLELEETAGLLQVPLNP